MLIEDPTGVAQRSAVTHELFAYETAKAITNEYNEDLSTHELSLASCEAYSPCFH